MFTLELYRLPNGRQPVKEFLSSIDNLKLRAKVYRKLKQLEDFGITLREPDSKALGEGIFELRVKQSSNIARCLFFLLRRNDRSHKRIHKKAKENSAQRYRTRFGKEGRI